MTAAFDVVVLGSGFAGSLLGTILASRGRSVAVIDRGTHPRFTIGESSTPTADLLLSKLTRQYGLTELEPLVTFGSWQRSYPNVACGCKRGFSYLWHGDEEGFRATQDHACELLVAATATRDQADTQWYRPDVDMLFASVAQGRGVTFFDHANVRQVTHEANRDWRVEMTRDDRTESVRARFVVDASGPSGLLLKTMGASDLTQSLRTNTKSVYSHFRDVPKVESWLRDSGAVVGEYPYDIDDSAVHHLFRDGWLWRLRFESGTTSLGFVTNLNSDPAHTTWESVLDRHPVLKSIFGQATLANFPGRVFATSRLQRLSSLGAGDDWAALPFTVGFIDPLHSTGIAHSLSGVDRLCEILLSDDDAARASRLQHYSTSVVNELKHVDRVIAGCYEGLRDFRLFRAWTMVYFAAATTSEMRWLEFFEKSPDNAIPPGFLCADDAEFVRTVESLSGRLDEFKQCGAKQRGSKQCGKLDDQRIEYWVDEVRDSLEPFNHVGLFQPQLPNLYCRTAVV